CSGNRYGRRLGSRRDDNRRPADRGRQIQRKCIGRQPLAENVEQLGSPRGLPPIEPEGPKKRLELAIGTDVRWDERQRARIEPIERAGVLQREQKLRL